jgi:hypothetical protein
MKNYIAKAGSRELEVWEACPEGEPTLEQMQAAVPDTYFQLVRINDGEMYVDEEGKLTGKPFNLVATLLFRSTHGALADSLLGDCIVRLNDDVSLPELANELQFRVKETQ